MKRFTVFALMALLLALALIVSGCGKKDGDTKSATSAPASSAPSKPVLNLQDGQWEITTQGDMPGMPGQARKPFTITTCLSKQDYMPQQKGEIPPDCKQDHKISGNTVTFSSVCKDSSVSGTYTYSGTSFEGNTQSKIKMEGKEMVINSTVKGKYLGPCPAGQTAPQVKK